ncbi:hypothetical protein HDU91_001913 [Kappamyces sp. JEL0680]|nr:hypothetical protein HDU91_001913 [Kappamyces sp. JEL0680]
MPDHDSIQLLDLPVEIMQWILSFCSPGSCLSLSIASKKLKQILMAMKTPRHIVSSQLQAPAKTLRQPHQKALFTLFSLSLHTICVDSTAANVDLAILLKTCPNVILISVASKCFQQFEAASELFEEWIRSLAKHRDRHHGLKTIKVASSFGRWDTINNSEVICSHLYQNGYLKGLYADLIVRMSYQGMGSNRMPVVLTAGDALKKSQVDGIMFKLHRLMAIRSPVLAEMIHDVEGGDNDLTLLGKVIAADARYQPTLSLTLITTDPYLTPRGLGVAFGHLYASYSSLLLQDQGGPSESGESTPQEERALLLRSVLSAAHLLQLPDLVAMCTEHIKTSIDLDSVVPMARFLSDTTSTLGLQDLKDAVFTYLCKDFFQDLMVANGLVWGNDQGKGYQEAVRVFSLLPFDWLKGVVESVYFDVPSDMDRFQFAKTVVDLRQSASGKNSMVAGLENVLLSFGGQQQGKKHGVTIVRRARPSSLNGPGAAPLAGKERRVWKASSQVNM